MRRRRDSAYLSAATSKCWAMAHSKLLASNSCKRHHHLSAYHPPYAGRTEPSARSGQQSPKLPDKRQQGGGGCMLKRPLCFTAR